MAAAPGAVSYLLNHILHRPPPSPPSSCFLKPLLLISTVSSSKNLLKCPTGLSHRRHESTIKLFPSLLSHRLPPRLNSSTGSLSLPLEKETELEDDNDNGDDDEAQELEIEDYHEDGYDYDDDEEEESEKVDMAEGSKVGLDSLRVRTQGMKLPSLTVKEKKELASYAHSLGKKLKSQLVGKSGVTASVAASFVENLESNELLKIKIHRTCPGELDDTVKQLEAATGSVVVGEIGRTVILYRPSLTKLKAEAKKKENQKIFMRRKLRAKPAFQTNGARPRLSGRGRRGSSRF
ncbi:RNA-binding, CRM domain containing protein [Parasponia andersonii]|uniref:RNA-binding, CRM domain containing protein n=1 Tax=Parasponia andersonii TaxID=3476 RepID=A0A2P5BGR6_PARAD|nr:RNA-binding, CRM domain containing protein [Parasponia andersonii]